MIINYLLDLDKIKIKQCLQHLLNKLLKTITKIHSKETKIYKNWRIMNNYQ